MCLLLFHFVLEKGAGLNLGGSDYYIRDIFFICALDSFFYYNIYCQVKALGTIILTNFYLYSLIIILLGKDNKKVIFKLPGASNSVVNIYLVGQGILTTSVNNCIFY